MQAAALNLEQEPVRIRNIVLQDMDPFCITDPALAFVIPYLITSLCALGDVEDVIDFEHMNLVVPVFERKRIGFGGSSALKDAITSILLFTRFIPYTSCILTSSYNHIDYDPELNVSPPYESVYKHYKTPMHPESKCPECIGAWSYEIQNQFEETL